MRENLIYINNTVTVSSRGRCHRPSRRHRQELNINQFSIDVYGSILDMCIYIMVVVL